MLLGVVGLALVAVGALVLFFVLRSRTDYSATTSGTTVTATTPSSTVSATVDATPVPTPSAKLWGSVQDLADVFPGQIPSAPGATGSAGQTCKNAPAQSNYSTGKILCDFPDGQVLTALRYANEHNRDLRLEELSAESGAHTTSWSAGSETGKLVTNTTIGGDPSRWWTSDQRLAYAMFVRWPDHSARQLAVGGRREHPSESEQIGLMTAPVISGMLRNVR